MTSVMTSSPRRQVAVAHLVSEGLKRTQGSCTCQTVAALICEGTGGADMQVRLVGVRIDPCP